jgi:hypothetical protein
MCQFELKTHREGQEYTRSHFFILSRGMNSGKPMKEPCPNCFACITANPEDAEKLYWTSFALWQGRKFHEVLVGSVIPFIRKRELQNLIQLGLHSSESQPDKFQKTLVSLRQLQQQESNYQKLQKSIKDLKLIMVHKLLAS